MPRVVGLLLAAGEGRRFGMPKALVRDDGDRPWVVEAARVLAAGGCDEVVVVIGARAEDVRRLLLAEPVRVVEAVDWAEGMGESLRVGLAEVAGDPADAVLVHLVDLPDVGAGVIRRLTDRASASALLRATYDGRPGHPVLLGRVHWADIATSVGGDRGARDHLEEHGASGIECGDLATGLDIDRR